MELEDSLAGMDHTDPVVEAAAVVLTILSTLITAAVGPALGDMSAGQISTTELVVAVFHLLDGAAQEEEEEEDQANLNTHLLQSLSE